MMEFYSKSTFSCRSDVVLLAWCLCMCCFDRIRISIGIRHRVAHLDILVLLASRTRILCRSRRGFHRRRLQPYRLERTSSVLQGSARDDPRRRTSRGRLAQDPGCVNRRILRRASLRSYSPTIHFDATRNAADGRQVRSWPFRILSQGVLS